MILIHDRYKYKTTGSIWEVEKISSFGVVELVCIFSTINSELGEKRAVPQDELLCMNTLWEYRQPIQRMSNEPDIDIDRLTTGLNLIKEDLVMPKKPEEDKLGSDRPNIPVLNKHWVDKVPIIRYRGIKNYGITLLECSRDYLLYAIDNQNITVNKYILNENDYMTLIKDPDSFWNEHIDPFLKKTQVNMLKG